MKTLIFTYGTLMQGGKFSRALEGSKYICDATIPRHICFDLPYGYPMVIDTKVEIDNYVKGEIWEVSGLQLMDLDAIEGYDEVEDRGLYLRREIIATDTLGKEYKVFYYLWNRPLVKDSTIVPSGVKWREDGKY